MSTYKLYYLNGRGRAEVSRLIFAYAGQNYEDIRYEYSEWPAHKSETPLGQVPVLEFNGVKLPQSISIARFLAKQFQLAGRDNLEQAKVDAVIDTLNEMMFGFASARWASDETKREELIKKFFTDDLSKHLKNLENLHKLYSHGGSFFVGNQLTWADLHFHYIGETLLEFNPDCFNEHLWLKKNMEEVAKQPRIAEYLKNRPKTSF